MNFGKAAAAAAIFLAVTACGTEQNPLYGTWEPVDPELADADFFGSLTFHPGGNFFQPLHTDGTLTISGGNFTIEEDEISWRVMDAYMGRNSLVELGGREEDWDRIDWEAVRVDPSNESFPSFMEGHWRRVSWADALGASGPMTVSANFAIDDSGELVLELKSFGLGSEITYYDPETLEEGGLEQDDLVLRYRRVE